MDEDHDPVPLNDVHRWLPGRPVRRIPRVSANWALKVAVGVRVPSQPQRSLAPMRMVTYWAPWPTVRRAGEFLEVTTVAEAEVMVPRVARNRATPDEHAEWSGISDRPGRAERDDGQGMTDLTVTA
jgi:hypothetical protein